MKKILFSIVLMLLVAGVFAQFEIQNALATPGSGNVTISYDLIHAENLPCSISIEVSADGGANYTIVPTAVSGDIGANIVPGTGKLIIWHPALDNMEIGANYRVRITADDGQSAPPAGFVYVPGGTFTMGDTHGVGWPEELPTHSVTLNSFYMGTYEVTQAEYAQYMPPYPGWTSDNGLGDNYPAYYISWYAILKYCNLRSIAEGLTPAYSISGSTDPADWGTVPTDYYNTAWDAAICNWSANGYRLPTEAEWEYAARGATNTPDYLYSGSDDINAVAWYPGNSGDTSHPVGTKYPNGLGLYDMSGNIAEWCWDWYSATYYSSSPSNHPTGPASGSHRVRRGGHWSLISNHCRVADRGGEGFPYNRNLYHGFRLCRSADTMIHVEGGTFSRQNSDGTYPNPEVMVTLSSFYIDRYEVTQASYQAVMGTNPSWFSGNPNRPVEQVSWFKAIEYCNRRSMQEGLSPCYSYGTFGTNPNNWPAGWNTSNANHTNVSCNWSASGYRLPTEMEWMFAAKGGNQSQGYTYSGSNTIGNVARFSANSSSRTWDVGSLASNELGTFDMSGNVWEWVWDIYAHPYPSGSQNNPTGANSGSNRVSRGGGWYGDAAVCTVSDRNLNSATSAYSGLGFRVIRVSP